MKNSTPRVIKGSRRGSATSVKKVTNVIRASNAFGGGGVASSYPSSGYTASKLGVAKRDELLHGGYSATPATVTSTSKKIVSSANQAHSESKIRNLTL